MFYLYFLVVFINGMVLGVFGGGGRYIFRRKIYKFWFMELWKMIVRDYI